MDIEKLFYHAMETKRLELEGIIPSHISEQFLSQINVKIIKEIDFKAYLSVIPQNQVDYWYDIFLFDNDKKIQQLKDLMQNQHTNYHIGNKLMLDFINFPLNIKKEFYRENFAVYKKDQFSRNLLQVCGYTYSNLESVKIYHNIPTLYLVTNKSNFSQDLFDILCKDYKETMGLTDNQFLNHLGASIVNFASSKVVKENWFNLQLDGRKDLRQIFAMKYYNRNIRNFTSIFLEDIKNNLLEYDIETPNKKKPMKDILEKSLMHVLNNITSAPLKKENLLTSIDEAKNLFNKMTYQHDLSFITPDIFQKTIEDIKKKSKIVRGIDIECEKELLDLYLIVKSMNAKKNKETLKVKV